MFVISKFFRKYFGGKRNKSLEEGNEYLKEMILSGKPFIVMRMGFSELDIMYKNMDICTFRKYKDPAIVEKGLFGSDKEEVAKYCRLVLETYQKSDCIVNWYSNRNEAVLLKEYAPQAEYCSAELVEPYYFKDPWSRALKNKRVLIVSPFVEAIKEQYKKRADLFDREILPEMDLVFVKSVWYTKEDSSSEFSSWFEALDFLKDRITNTDFDIALLSCGGFGTPLLAHIKSLGKQAIYVGGALQILFGIKGKRWDSNPFFKNMYNDSWISLDESTKPYMYKKVDNGCYW